MRKLKNVLYVTTPEAYLAREGEDLLVCLPEDRKVRVPAINLASVVQMGYPGASPAALALCMEHGICVSFLQPSGKFLARVEGAQSGSVLLRKCQYRISEDKTTSAKIANQFASAKILNCRTVLRRGMRDHAEKLEATAVSNAEQTLFRLAKNAALQLDGDRLRGIEGEAAKHYFDVFDELVLENKQAFSMNGRNRRPPLDRINCLLSFCYTLLEHDCRGALESVGLDPQVGFLHRDRPGRASLALDLMEELRPVMADRNALTLINRKQIVPKDFVIQADGAVLLTSDARKTIIDNWQKRKQEELTHPYLEEKIQFGLLPFVQAQLLAGAIRTQSLDYPAFVWR